MTVDKRVGKEESSLVGVEDVHCAKMVETLAYADNVFGNLDSVAVTGVNACDKGIGVAGFYHHHTKVVAVEHLVVGLLESHTLTLAFFGEDFGVTFAAVGFAVGTEVDDFDAVEVEFEFFGYLGDFLGVAEEDRIADAFVFGLDSSLHHIGVDTFGKYHTLGRAAGKVVKLSRKFRLVAHQLIEALFVAVPIGDSFAGNA